MISIAYSRSEKFTLRSKIYCAETPLKAPSDFNRAAVESLFHLFMRFVFPNQRKSALT